jgi:hypothetical protein
VWGRRLLAAAPVAALLLVGGGLAAFAADCPAPDDTSAQELGSTWTWGPYLTDTRCVPLGLHSVFIDPGSLFTNTLVMVWSILLNLGWAIYKATAVFGISVLDFVLSFDWLTPILAPLDGIAQSLSRLLTTMNVVPAFLTLSALVAVLMMARGRWAGGIYELAASLLIAALAVGILANPMRSVTEDNGLLDRARTTGMEIAGRLAGASADPREEPAARAAAREASAVHGDVIQAMGDTFVRTPAQVLSFGHVLTGACADAYDEAVAGIDAQLPGSSTVRDAIAGCDEQAAANADNPGPGQLGTLLVIQVSAWAMLLFTLAMAMAVVVTTLWVLFQAVKAVVALVVGLLPGRARGMLWMTAADLIVALVTLVLIIVFLTGTLLLIEAVFRDTGAVMGRFILVDVLLLGAIAVWWRIKRSLTRTSDRLAEALGSRPATPQRNGGSTPLPTREPVVKPAVATAVKVGSAAFAWRRLNALKDMRGNTAASAPQPMPRPGTGAGPAPSPQPGPPLDSGTGGVSGSPPGDAAPAGAGGRPPGGRPPGSNGAWATVDGTGRAPRDSSAADAVTARIAGRRQRANLRRATTGAVLVAATAGAGAPAAAAAAAAHAVPASTGAAAGPGPAQTDPRPSPPSGRHPGSTATSAHRPDPTRPPQTGGQPVSRSPTARERLEEATRRAARRGQAAAAILRRR